MFLMPDDAGDGALAALAGADGGRSHGDATAVLAAAARGAGLEYCGDDYV